MSIRDRPTAPRSPWQNGYCERAIGSIRRECLDHVVVFGERHLRHLLRSYATYYNEARTTFRSTRTRRRREQYMPLVASCLRHFLADFIICMCEFDFRQAQVTRNIQRSFHGLLPSVAMMAPCDGCPKGRADANNSVKSFAVEMLHRLRWE